MPFDVNNYLQDAATAGGALIGAVGQIEFGQSHLQYGENEMALAQFTAQQLQQNAKTTVGAGGINAWLQGQKTKEMVSDQRAAAAAGGGSASDPTMIQLMGRTAGRGALMASQDLFQAQNQARTMNLQAQGALYSGQLNLENAKTINTNSDMSAFASLLKPAATLYSKYGAGDPNQNQNTPDPYTSGGALFGQGINPFAPQAAPAVG